jgi:1,4-dihydroxy-2-naphthoyl-CoA hydrolase
MTDDQSSSATAYLHGTMPFAKACGIRISAATPAEVHGEMDWAPDLCTVAGVMHGGALMTFADTIGATCAAMNLPAGATTTTVESKTNFFRALRGGHAHAVATPLHVGRTLIVVQTDIRDDEKRRVALVTQTQAVLITAR